MALEEFTGKTVLPGEPLTAQSWNEIIAAMGSVTDYLLSSEASAVRVQVANAGIDLATVRVTATPESGDQAFEAVDPIAPGTEHVFAGLRPGVY
ncbi:MAG TPA: hypothetical protein VJ997_14430, partial [Longimicrobiales bacterium]|nr:hypothetical protein [Longimicrobiales bacterium]